MFMCVHCTESFCNFWFCPIFLISSSPTLYSHSLLPTHTQSHLYFLKSLTSSWNNWDKGDILIQMKTLLDLILWEMQAMWVIQVQRVLDMDSCHVVASCSKVRNHLNQSRSNHLQILLLLSSLNLLLKQARKALRCDLKIWITVGQVELIWDCIASKNIIYVSASRTMCIASKNII